MKRYLCRYVHHIDGLPDFSALRFTKYNQYESMILPLVKYLESHGVRIEYGMDVKNVIIETEGDRKIAKQIVYVKDGDDVSSFLQISGASQSYMDFESVRVVKEMRNRVNRQVNCCLLYTSRCV